MKKVILNILLSESQRPYLFIISLSFLLMTVGFLFDVGSVGRILGKALGSVDWKTNPVFFVGIVFIYSIRKPYLAIAATILFAAFYQIYLSEFIDFRRLLGLTKLPYFSFGRIYGALLLLSFLGSCHFIIQKITSKNSHDTKDNKIIN